jgi:GTPase
MLVDEAEIEVTGGHGGPGKASFFKKARGPDGGNGGKGGAVYFQGTGDLFALNRFASKKSFAGPDGEAGGSNKKSGANAKDITLIAPIGTDLIDLDTEEVFTITSPEQKILICVGGIGGLGNADRANARMTTPLKAQPGLPGQKRRLKLTLKLIADFGLAGLPNAGKSSLLNALTNAQAAVGNYAFTTLEPNLGTCGGKIIADIPGLIFGASQGKGLGFQFLKHIEKVPVILHCVSADAYDPYDDYRIVRDEMSQYNPELLAKEEVILLTKSDLVGRRDIERSVKILKKAGKLVFPVSIIDDESLDRLKREIILT